MVRFAMRTKSKLWFGKGSLYLRLRQAAVELVQLTRELIHAQVTTH